MRSLDKALLDPRLDPLNTPISIFDNILEESRQKFDNDREVIKKLFQHVKYEEFEEAYNFFIKQSWEGSSVLTNCLFPNSDPSLKKYNEAHTQLHRFLLNSSSEDKNTKLKNFYEASRSKDFNRIKEEQDKNFNENKIDFLKYLINFIYVKHPELGELCRTPLYFGFDIYIDTLLIQAAYKNPAKYNSSEMQPEITDCLNKNKIFGRFTEDYKAQKAILSEVSQGRGA
ncbi:hypothetical protein I862_04985 [endosymbiont of Acanthamoeba sp. UWC8]|uniref:hypothetical protein n=1 Tax=endosymbiont of Acanthamoeba sp. UWC8 TaxID=86106 RepID=UPI0004D101BA|nr:hypothetical protein [endosymbiont of Acanthamoeba sp. UWC8]AIF81553.1 hypothetical protein I862_04985 [endosymbiont of Acanthamoeba sp. UWC8]